MTIKEGYQKAIILMDGSLGPCGYAKQSGYSVQQDTDLERRSKACLGGHRAANKYTISTRFPWIPP